MTGSYLANSRIAHISLAVMVLAFVAKFAVGMTGLPIWLVPVGYFAALIAAGALFVGWVRWRSPALDGS